MWRALWNFLKNRRWRALEIDFRSYNELAVKSSQKLVCLLAEQRELQRLERIDKCGGEKLSVDNFIRLHAELPPEIKWEQEEFDRLVARRDKLEKKLREVSSFFATVA